MSGPQASAREPSQMGQKDCQREAREAFEKLCSWREQSQNQFTDIINSYSDRISRGISDLVEKVGEQQTELSVIRKERDVLLETVDNLNVEIRHLSAKFHNLNSQDKHFEHSTQVLDNLKKDRNAPEQDVERQIIKSEPGQEEELVESIHNEDNSDPNVMENKRYQLDDSDYVEDTAINDNADVHGNNVEHRLAKNNHSQNKLASVQKKKDEIIIGNTRKGYSPIKEENLQTSEKNLHTECYICPECCFEFSTNENLKIHMTNVHPTMEVSEESPRSDEQSREQSDNHVGDECDYSASAKDELITRMLNAHKIKENVFKCDLCPQTTTQKRNLKRHIQAVHAKIRDSVCEKCDYSATQKSDLRNHMMTVHKIGEKTFKCDQCNYISTRKTLLNRHINLVHYKIRNHTCKYCGYAASENNKLEIHVKRVHDRIRNHVCDKCDYAASQKRDLMLHMVTIHKMGEKKFKCDQCPYTSALKSRLTRHRSALHEKIRNVKSMDMLLK